MSIKKSKVTIHMVSSLDGFIAAKDGNVSWLQLTDKYEKGTTLSKEEVEKFVSSIDCYVMGSNTFEHALKLGWPYGDTPVIVLTHRHLSNERKNVQFYAGHLEVLINKKLRPNYKNIWIVGGAEITKSFIQLNLADDIIISIMPIILGGGTLFFDYIGAEQKLHLKDVTAYKDGMVELWYSIIKE
jgi:dihydrofolate reductase